MNIALRNTALLPLALAQQLGASPTMAGSFVDTNGLQLNITRPWERQPRGVLTSDPFSDIIRCFRVVMDRRTPNHIPKNEEPPFHVLLQDLERVAGRIGLISERLPLLGKGAEVPIVEVWAAHYLREGQPPGDDNRGPLCCWLGAGYEDSSQIITDSKFCLLYLSMVHEMLARATGLPMGPLFLKFNRVADSAGMTARIISLADEFVDPYEVEPDFVPFDFVGPSLSNWASEVDVMRGAGAMGMRDPAVRGILVPALQAQAMLANEEEGHRRFSEAKLIAGRIISPDWRAACLAWIETLENQSA